MSIKKNEKMVKVVFAGETNVGKTSIVERSIFERHGQHTPTVGAAFAAKKVIHKDKSVMLGIWDTAGQERYQSMSAIYFRQAIICVLVFDLTKRESFRKIPMWKDLCDEANCDYQTSENSDIPIYILIGNKLDMKDKAVTMSEIEQYCTANNIRHYIETSAVTGVGIDKLYEAMAEESCNIKLPLSKKLAIHPLPPDNKSQCPCY